MVLTEVLAISIPIFALMIPIVAILTSHQRKMAELVHGRGGSGVNPNELAALRAEVHELKGLVQSQMIALDTYMGNSKRLGPPPPPPGSNGGGG
jgi:hypothetical protein